MQEPKGRSVLLCPRKEKEARQAEACGEEVQEGVCGLQEASGFVQELG